MNKERMKEIIEGIAKLTGTSDIKRLASAITWHHEIEAMLESEINLDGNYASVKCCSFLELQYVLEYAKSQGKKCGELLKQLSEFPVLIYLDGDIVGWNDSMDRIGKKYSFIQFVEHIRKGGTK